MELNRSTAAQRSRRPWTIEEDEYLRATYPLMDRCAQDIAEALGRTDRSVYTRARMLGITKPKEYLVGCGHKLASHPSSRATRFASGHIPDNKGKPMSPELYMKVSPTMFKKGNIPKKHREVGSERINVDGYIEIKVAEPNKWMQKSRMIWEQANGPVPPGHNVQFRDGNKLNCQLDNLYLISRREQLLTQNSLIARYPEDLRNVIRLRGAVKRQINRINKQNNESK